MCSEKKSQVVEITYEIVRYNGGDLRRTGWTRVGKAARNRYGRWCVSHNGKFRRLHHIGASWCVYV